jgi:NADPH:quinone reductase
MAARARLHLEIGTGIGQGATHGRAELDGCAASLFDAVARGQAKVDIKQRYNLADAGRAQRDVEARRSTASTIHLP